MNFHDYQSIIETFAVYPRDNELVSISYLALGLNGEAGEVADEVKKAIRNDGWITPERRARILDQIGDVLWCITRLAIEFNTPLAEVAQANIDKLERRRESNQLRHE
jgi:NTP pyrophosphatase (non-canonical NTP hydrolase)